MSDGDVQPVEEFPELLLYELCPGQGGLVLAAEVTEDAVGGQHSVGSGGAWDHSARAERVKAERAELLPKGLEVREEGWKTGGGCSCIAAFISGDQEQRGSEF